MNNDNNNINNILFKISKLILYHITNIHKGEMSKLLPIKRGFFNMMRCKNDLMINRYVCRYTFV